MSKFARSNLHLDRFSLVICCKIVRISIWIIFHLLFVVKLYWCLKRAKVNEKEAANCPFENVNEVRTRSYKEIFSVNLRYTDF